jgi:hypothetical protein
VQKKVLERLGLRCHRDEEGQEKARILSSYPVVVGNDNELRSISKWDRGLCAGASAVGDLANSWVAFIPWRKSISCRKYRKIKVRLAQLQSFRESTFSLINCLVRGTHSTYHRLCCI